MLLRKHVHRAITPEVRRELFSSQCRHNAPPVVDDIGVTPAQLFAATLNSRRVVSDADAMQ